MKKPRTEEDGDIRGKIADALTRAMAARGVTHDRAAAMLQVEVGTLYKYLAGEMIPGGHVLWRACRGLGLVLDRKGLRVTRERAGRSSDKGAGTEQYEFPFVNQSMADNRVRLMIRRKNPESDYVHVALRIRVND